MQDPQNPRGPTAYRTKDLGYAACLHVAAVPFKGCVTIDGDTHFEFEDMGAEMMRALRNEYYADKARVAALSYSQSLKKLRKARFDEKKAQPKR